MQPSGPKLPASTDLTAVDKLTEETSIPFVQAENYTPAKRGKGNIQLIVIHAMDGHEDAKRAEGCANWMAGKLAPKFPAPEASAHYAVDSDSVVQMVRDRDVAWHSPGANRQGLGIEHAGKASQTQAEWLDKFGTAMLQISASLVARLCLKYAIPAHYLTADELKRGHWGLVTHSVVNEAYKKSKHTDPGPGFPLVWYLQQVKAAHLRLSVR